MTKARFTHGRLERLAARIVHVFVEENGLRHRGEDHLDKIIRDRADLDLVGEIPSEGDHGGIGNENLQDIETFGEILGFDEPGDKFLHAGRAQGLEEIDGRLCVELSGKRVSRRRSFRRRLREKRRLYLEAWTGRILEVALNYLERRRQVLLDQERRVQELEQWKADCEHHAQMQAAIVRKRQEERRRTDALLKGEKEWRRAKEFREFINACCDRMIEEGEAPDHVARWAEWAESKTGGSS